MFIISRKRDITAYSSLDASSAVQITFIAISILIILLKHRRKAIDKLINYLTISNSKYIFIFSLICFISIIWSGGPLLTFYRSIEQITIIFLIALTLLILRDKLNHKEIYNWVAFYIYWNFLLLIATRIKLVGINTFSIPFNPGRLFIPLFFFIILFQRKKIFTKVSALIVNLIFLSNKVYLGITAGFLAFFIGNKTQKILSIFLLILGSIYLSFIDVENFLLNTVFYGRENISLEDSTGRNNIWEYLISEGNKQYLLGYGYAYGENYLLSPQYKGVINAHNIFLSAYISVGFIGPLLMIFYFASCFKSFISIKQTRIRIMCVSSLMLIIIINSLGPGLGGRVYGAFIPSFFILTFLELYYTNRFNKKNKIML